jgi:hypothetical protein
MLSINRAPEPSVGEVLALLGEPARRTIGPAGGGWVGEEVPTISCSYWYAVGEPDGGGDSWDEVSVCFEGATYVESGRGNDMDRGELKRRLDLDDKVRGQVKTITFSPSEGG